MIDITYDLNFIKEADIPMHEKYQAMEDVMALVRDYESWSSWKDSGGIEQRKKVIRMTKQQQQKKLDTLRNTLDILTRDDMDVSGATLQELLDIYLHLKDEDIIQKVEDAYNGQLPKKPNTDKIKAKLIEIHDTYSIPHETDNIRDFLSLLS